MACIHLEAAGVWRTRSYTILLPRTILYLTSYILHAYYHTWQVGEEKVYVREVSAVSPLALLLFGGEVEVSHASGTVTIDGQISFESPGRVAVLVRELRTKLDGLLSEKIAQPTLDISSHPVLAAIVNLITTERAGVS